MTIVAEFEGLRERKKEERKEKGEKERKNLVQD